MPINETKTEIQIDVKQSSSRSC